MLVEFVCFISFGRCDGGDIIIEMEITEEENERLRKAFDSGEEFSECEDVQDIYDRAYAIANEDATRDLLADGMLEDGQEADDLYTIEVQYPFSDEDDEDEEW